MNKNNPGQVSPAMKAAADAWNDYVKFAVQRLIRIRNKEEVDPMNSIGKMSNDQYNTLSITPMNSIGNTNRLNRR